MATLHMDVEAVRSAHQNIMTQHGNLTSTLQQINSLVNQTVGSTWVGNSAVEFQGQYDQIRAAIVQQLDRLSQLASVLQTEISQWEQMASKLG